MSPSSAWPLQFMRENLVLPGAIGFAFAAQPGSAESAGYLHPNEQRTADAFRYPRRQTTYLLGRRAAKAALAVCFSAVAPRDIEIVNGVFGQPRVRAAGLDVEISLTHSEQIAVAVACPGGHPVGVDLELLDADRAAVAETQLTPEERAQLPASLTPPEFGPVACWAMREALGKVLRCGLTVPAEILAVEGFAARPGGCTARFRHFGQYRSETWRLGHHVLALVLPRLSALHFPALDEMRARVAALPPRADSPAG